MRKILITVLRSHFAVTNGVLCPISSAEIQKSNEIGGDIKKLFTDFRTGKADRDQFLKRVEGIVTKHQGDGSTTSGPTVRATVRP